MIEEASVDAYGDSEQTTGWYTMLEERLALPFETTVLGVVVKVVALDLRGDNTIVAICARGRERQLVPILDLPLPSPKPKGVEWIDAYRHWIGGLTTRSDRRLRGGRQPEILGGRPGWQEAAVHRDERCPIFRQLGDQELTKTVRTTAKNTFQYKRNAYQNIERKIVCMLLITQHKWRRRRDSNPRAKSVPMKRGAKSAPKYRSIRLFATRFATIAKASNRT
jgi:hypothetical protein